MNLSAEQKITGLKIEVLFNQSRKTLILKGANPNSVIPQKGRQLCISCDNQSLMCTVQTLPKVGFLLTSRCDLGHSR